ncbi:MAG: ribose 5-phosphate isomerase B [Thermotogae bacterium]|nr:ribose 5-phosphate isomerase B [Thermotogota bacterium]
MRIALGSDHRGYALKEFLKEALRREGYDVVDVGTDSPERTDYPIYAKAVGRKVASGEVRFGVLICATGIGMSIAANKVRGVRAAHVCDDELVKLSRRHNDANVLCFGSLYTDEETALRWVKLFLTTEFEGGRHSRRVAMLEEG